MRDLPNKRGAVIRRRLAIGGAGGLGAFLLLLTLGARHRSGIIPATNAVFTSTRYVTSLAVAPGGTLWAGTLGGVLQRSPEGTWRKFTRLDGLPSNEARSLRLDSAAPVAVFPRASAVWQGQRWRVEPDSGLCDVEAAQQTCATTWQGRPCVATVTGLCLGVGKAARIFPLPPSPGTHISALLPRGPVLWAALYGDGLWTFNGKAWKPLPISLPAEARQITALVADNERLWVGTRRAGIWMHDGTGWRHFLQTDEPYNADCQALALYNGALYVSTLEDGLVVRTPRGWGHLWAGALSSNAARQMALFGGRLYLRHGSGKVDSFDGKHWSRNICAGLARPQVTALAADAHRLYVAQWGGWSEFDGMSWTSHLDRPELQGTPITALYPDGDALWIGTQGHGLAEIDRATGRLRWHDEREGLSDDWITTIQRIGKTLYAGTFVGGLARREGARWIGMLPGQNVTALAPDSRGGLYIATRAGVWHLNSDGALESLTRRFPFLDTEAQSLCVVGGGLWVGTRTGLTFCKGL